MIPIFEKAHQLDLTGTEEEILQYFESNLPASIYTSLNDLSAASTPPMRPLSVSARSWA